MAEASVYEGSDSGGSFTMKKIISASFLAVLSLIMLLPVARQVNAASVNHSVLRQAGNPMPGGSGGGH
jgi:hypothetical protein